MVKMYTAYTLEVDDKDYALKEILQQLNLEQNQRKYTAGILICHSDFIETGVTQEIAEKLPFDVVGCTSLANMITGMDDSLMLTVSIFTSDDIRFSAFGASDLENRDSVAKAYTAAKLDNAPALVVPFIPLLISIAHEQIMLDLDEVTDGVPIYGAVAADHTPDYSTCYTILNGKVSKSSMTALAFWGDLNPVFYYSEMSEKYIQRQRAVITKSEGNMLIEVNHISVPEYLKTIGVMEGAAAETLGAVPLLIDFGDGTPLVARGLHTITEDGHAYCGGFMPENAALGIGSIERDDVLRLTDETLQSVMNSGKNQGLLMFPCGSHFLVLGADAQEQKDIIANKIQSNLPYQLCYSGGEICPAYDEEGKIHNRFHSFTFTACVF